MPTSRRLPKGTPALKGARSLHELAVLVERALRDIIGGLRGLPTPHADTHRPSRPATGGDDPLATAAPANPTGTAASEGVAGTLLRSDSTTKQGIVTAQGQLLGHNATVPAAVPAPGSDDLVLTSDLAEPTRMRWATGASGWTDDGSIVRLTDENDIVSIGRDVPIEIEAGFGAPKLSVSSTLDPQAGTLGLEVETAVAASAAADISFLRRRSGVNVVNDGDTLGRMNFYGADGVDASRAAEVSVQVDGTPTWNDMPGRLLIGTTPDGSNVPVTRVCVDRDGNVGIGDNFTNPIGRLHIDGGLDTQSYSDQYNTGASGPEFTFRKSRGSKGAESQVVANDRLMAIHGRGWHSGGAFGGNAIDLRFLCIENFTSTQQGTAFTVLTNTRTTTSLAQRLRVDDIGVISGAGAPHSRLQADGPLALAYLTVSADTTLDNTHSTVGVDTTAANRTITLPTAVGISGRLYTVKRRTAGANTLTVQGTGGETIDGAASISLPLQWTAVRLQSDGANWITV